VEILVTVESKTDGAVQEARGAAERGLTLGRGPDSPVALTGPGISREHVRFEANGDGLAIIDLSSNGTWVNSERLGRGEKRALKPQDQVEVPGYIIRVSVPGPVAVSAAGTAEVAAAAPAPVPPAPAQSKSAASAVLDRVRSFAGSFTGLERFLVFVAICSLAVLMAYLSL
jgi:predicted component of type VI protein secretion system